MIPLDGNYTIDKATFCECEYVALTRNELADCSVLSGKYIIDLDSSLVKLFQLSTGTPHGPLYPMPIPIFAIAISP